jgi:hypothetical protein
MRTKKTGQRTNPTGQKLIAAMAAKGYWVNPHGQMPQATLYAAILREITTKGAASRFVKDQRDQFTLNGVASPVRLT